jgi:hypothetical protein
MRRPLRVLPLGQSPLSALQREREGPVAQRWEGEVGDAVNRLRDPPHPSLSPAGGPAGEREIGRTALRFRGNDDYQRSCENFRFSFGQRLPLRPG